MHERMHDNSLPLPERSHASKVWHDAELILAEVNKTTLRLEVQTPVFRPGQVNPHLVTALAGIMGRRTKPQVTKEIIDE
jgi:hypothetical protein